MTRVLWIARFFLVVGLVPRGLIAAFVVLTVAGAAAIASGVMRGAALLGPVLLFQLFAAASGFRVPARRGHYDLLLTRGAGRLTIGAMHWLLSALPGTTCWAALAVADRLAGSPELSAPDALVAMTVASTLPWAISVPGARMTGAIVVLIGYSVAIALPAPLITGVAMPDAGAGVAGVALASVVMAFIWIYRIDVPLESAQ